MIQRLQITKSIADISGLCHLLWNRVLVLYAPLLTCKLSKNRSDVFSARVNLQQYAALTEVHITLRVGNHGSRERDKVAYCGEPDIDKRQTIISMSPDVRPSSNYNLIRSENSSIIFK